MKNDSVIQVRCKRTTLATIGVYLHDKGMNPRSYSELCRYALEGLASMIVSTNSDYQVLNAVDATRILESLGLSSLNPQGRGRKNLMENLSLESFSQSQVFNPSKSDSIDEITKRVVESMKNEPPEHSPSTEEIHKALGIIPDNVKEE